MKKQKLPRTQISRIVAQCEAGKNNKNKSATAPLRWTNVVLDSLGDCGVEFMRLLVAASNEEAAKAAAAAEAAAPAAKKRKQSGRSKILTIEPVHMYEALRSLGFDAHMIKEAERACAVAEAQESNTRDRKRRRKSRGSTSAQDAATIAAEQARLFKAAARDMLGN